jgi:hypothetical protein
MIHKANQMDAHSANVLRPLSRAVACLAVLSLGGCLMTGDAESPAGQPGFYRSMTAAGAKLDTGSAQSMISGYRKNNGLSAVVLEPRLTRLAEEQARAMAARDKMDHNVTGPFQQRVDASGYRAKVAVENIGAGYHTLAEAFSGWRDSPPHRKNMLVGGATHMGIAAVQSPNSKYKVFWALVLASEDDRRASNGYAFGGNLRPVSADEGKSSPAR